MILCLGSNLYSQHLLVRTHTSAKHGRRNACGRGSGRIEDEMDQRGYPSWLAAALELLSENCVPEERCCVSEREQVRVLWCLTHFAQTHDCPLPCHNDQILR
jgi:hypothetical protein